MWSIFRENSSYTYFSKKGRFSNVTYTMLFTIHAIHYDHMEDVKFYSFDSFFFLRIVFDIFNINFHFCFLKSKFWDGFPSKIPFWLSRTSHENGPFMLHTPSCYAALFTVSHFLSEIFRILSQGIIQEFSLGTGSHVRITICQIFRLLP